MALHQHTFQSDADIRGFESAAIGLEHVSVSQLLGRDYVFVNTLYVALPPANSTLLYTLLDNLIDQLGLVEAHTVVISVHESLEGQTNFIRHDLSWHQHKICNVENTDIVQPEQHEFMDMIWRCSTAALPT